LISVAGHDDRFIRVSSRKITPLASVDNDEKEIPSHNLRGSRVPRCFSTRALNDVSSMDSIDFSFGHRRLENIPHQPEAFMKS
jgi:hypothetical protein